jgi:hypothetical protein
MMESESAVCGAAVPYDEQFFGTADRAAAMSADGVIGPLQAELRAGSVLDLGCARGVWLSSWLHHGAREVLGIDGNYVDTARLSIPRDAFLARDLSQPLRLGRQFDVVQSLEVAEHLPPAAAETFVDNLAQHGRVILFSAAIPGQGGEHHVNEQPLEYWRAKFAARGYDVFDFLRPRIRDERTIAFCYRYNALLFVHFSSVNDLPPAIRASRIEPGRPLADLLPFWMKLRILTVRCLPRAAVNWVARARYRLDAWQSGRRRRSMANSE